jgi:hypothetical protein
VLDGSREALTVSDWGRSVYGNPCRECGYKWSINVPDAIQLIRLIPERYAALIGDGDGSRHGAGLEWSSGAYVCHVTDNLRIWAERLVGVTRGSDWPIAQYDSDLLACARNYESVAVTGALWSLRDSVDRWAYAVAAAETHGVVLSHPVRGPQSVSDVVRNNAHDAHHHAWDIERIEASTSD